MRDEIEAGELLLEDLKELDKISPIRCIGCGLIRDRLLLEECRSCVEVKKAYEKSHVQ